MAVQTTRLVVKPVINESVRRALQHVLRELFKDGKNSYAWMKRTYTSQLSTNQGAGLEMYLSKKLNLYVQRMVVALYNSLLVAPKHDQGHYMARFASAYRKYLQYKERVGCYRSNHKVVGETLHLLPYVEDLVCLANRLWNLA